MLDGYGFEARWNKTVYVLQNSSDWYRDPPSLMYNGYRGSFPGVKRPTHVVHQHLYSHSVQVWQVTGRPLPLLPFIITVLVFRLLNNLQICAYSLQCWRPSYHSPLHPASDPHHSKFNRYFKWTQLQVSITPFYLNSFYRTIYPRISRALRQALT